MKRLSFLLSGFLAVALLTTSCSKEAPEPTKTSETATIKGVVTAELDQTEAGMENPSGVKVVALIDPADLQINPDSSFTSDMIKVEATTNSDGEYTMEVNARNQSIPVTLIFEDFAEDVETANDPVRTVFQGTSMTISVVAGVTEVVDHQY